MSEDSPHQSTPAEMVIEQPKTRDSLINQSSVDFVASAAEAIASRLHVQDVSHERDLQALEGHEVIELQAFIERKTWIEEKIKFLEKLPSIEVFVGVDALRTSSEEIPGLPTREQLDQWLIEHDKIEKETEIFDAGELKKLKKFTKAATQRNLSPQDTDLIELTLTTIYEFDKLLHLLRNRSDNLDLLAVRLTWEERRVAAWREIRQLLSDLREFLDVRARWSSSVYDDSAAIISIEDVPSNETGRKRRNSVTSMMSVASESSYAPTPAYSRSTRFKLAESLSRDAAQFSSRIASLRHTKIAGAGKALDKLIDQSRKPVPDELLDEQDNLENHGINELEDLGKFIMHVIMQWKKADDIYVETLKDESDAQTLLEEMEVAQLHHPTARQGASFLSRTNTLSKRLLVRGNPGLSSSSFPRPTHPLFPEQQDSNDLIIRTLANAFSSANEYVRKAEAYAKDYHATYDAVKRVEGLCNASLELSAQFDSLVDRLQNGVPTTSGDGSPPVQCDEACLEGSAHSVFLALLPSTLEELQKAEASARQLEQSVKITLLQLDRPGVSSQFKTDSAAELGRLADQRNSAIRLRDDVIGRASALDKAREVWTSMTELFQEMGDRRNEIVENMERQMWKKQFRSHDLPPTPESPAAPLPSAMITTFAMQERLDVLRTRIEEVVSRPLSLVTQTVQLPVVDHLTQCAAGLCGLVDNTKEIVRLWASVQQQVTGMIAVRDEVHTLQIRLEDIKVRFDQTSQGLLNDKLSSNELSVHESTLVEELQHCRTAVDVFHNSLPLRVNFISQVGAWETPGSASHKRRFSVSGKLTLELVREAFRFDLPFDPVALDNTIRADLNSYSMVLSGGLRSLEQRADYLQSAKLAKALDRMGASIADRIRHVSESLDHVQNSLLRIEGPYALQELDRLNDSLETTISTSGPEIASSLTSARERLHELKSYPKHVEPGQQENLVLTRQKVLADLDAQFQGLTDNAATIRKRISGGIVAEQNRLAAELRAKEVKERQEAEERARLELEAARRRLEEQMHEQALEAEKRAKAEREAEAQAQLERETAEKAELARLEKQREQEAESQRLMEELARTQIQTEDKLSHEAENLDVDEDVFGLCIAPSTGPVRTQESRELHARIFELRKRLLSLDLPEVVTPGPRSGVSLPDNAQRIRLQDSLSKLDTEIDDLRVAVAGDTTTMLEFRSFESEFTYSQKLMLKIHQLADFSLSSQSCDESLSDLLEHIDSYPSPPSATMSASYLPDISKPPEEQLRGRLLFVKALIEDMKLQSIAILDDSRAQSECERVLQTWSELQAMGMDRVNGQKSRPPSAMSSGRTSRTSQTKAAISKHMKKTSYSNLSASSGRFLAPPLPNTRRGVSSSSATGNRSRSSSRMSVSSSTRSVSGPVSPYPASPSLYGSTFSSRQRTNSVASGTPSTTPAKRPPSSVSRPRAQTGQLARVSSPTFSEASYSQSRSSLNLSRSSNRSTWARAPRQSFPSLPGSPPPKAKSTVKKPYVANPKNKLDVAVGDVVNKLPVNINVEVVADTWKDQSGKYWIGDQEPKLCFCRILRSETVMVRVGGGWAELSKFIKEHFADAFRLLPESPARPGTREEKWINSTSLSLSIQEESPFQPPRTPEPRGQPIPILAVSTPGGTSPRSIRAPSSPGSPLRAMQFIRRADTASPSLRPETPTKKPRSSLVPALNTPATVRQPVWRP